MKPLMALIKRNTKLYFKDKGMFFTSLVTPLILLVLYGTFLSNVYKDSFTSALNIEGIHVSETLVNGFVAGELVSSLLAVCCVTVAFCSNMLMVQDKVTGARNDLEMTSVSRSILALGYFIATMISTLVICYSAFMICLGYMLAMGWFLSMLDIFLLILDIFLLVLFGTALSSIIHFFLKTQGQISAVGTIISAGYGFLCGAYMPISQFSSGIQKVISFLPGTYGTSLLRNHALQGVFMEMEKIGFPMKVIDMIKDSIDCNLYFFSNKVDISTMYFILIGTIVFLMIFYILFHRISIKTREKN